MSELRFVEGEVANLTALFLDESEDPIYPMDDDMGPVVRVIDPEDKSIINIMTAVPDPDVPGQWSAAVGIPEMGLIDVKAVQVVWRYIGEDGSTYNLRDTLYIEPARQHRISDPVMLFDDYLPSDETNRFDLTVPVDFDPSAGDKLIIRLYKANQAIARYDVVNSGSVKVLGKYSDRIELSVPYTDTLDKLEPVTVVCSYVNHVTHKTKDHIFMLWVVTPQILNASRMVEDSLDKARLENVIPELEYTQSDLIQYLYRGLALFNNIPPRVTSFNGLNMQGVLLDNWILCSSYYALSAQLQAEGAMAFDFSGQTVSLNMDRSPSIESALGRIEGLIADRIRQSKYLITKAGLLSGDGSAGGRLIDGSQALGMVSVINAPTTKFGSTRNTLPWFNARMQR